MTISFLIFSLSFIFLPLVCSFRKPLVHFDIMWWVLRRAQHSRDFINTAFVRQVRFFRHSFSGRNCWPNGMVSNHALRLFLIQFHDLDMFSLLIREESCSGLLETNQLQSKQLEWGGEPVKFLRIGKISFTRTLDPNSFLWFPICFLFSLERKVV